MKKIVSIALIIVIAFILSTVSYADTSSLKIQMNSDSSNLKTDKIILLNIGLSEFVNISTNKPMAAEGTLVYNEELFENVTAEGKNGWIVTLSNKKFLLDAASIQEGKTIVTFTFKLKENEEIPNNISFNVTNFSITNDEDIDYEDLTLGEVKVNYSSNQNNQSNSEEESTGNSSNNDDTTSNDNSGSSTTNGNTNTGSSTTNQNDNSSNQQTENSNNNSENNQGTSSGTQSNTNIDIDIVLEGDSLNTNGSSNTSNADNNKIDKVDDLTVSTDKKIPQTGEKEFVTSIIALLFVSAIVLFIRYRSIEIKIR